VACHDQVVEVEGSRPGGQSRSGGPSPPPQAGQLQHGHGMGMVGYAPVMGF
jgi:hypothetical protein